MGKLIHDSQFSSDDIRIPSLKVDELKWLSNEEKERLLKYSPKTIRDLKELQGITPETFLRIFLLTQKLAKNEFKNVSAQIKNESF